ncbi:MAG: ABC transporter ATP-binding protein [Candidatus Magasanikbacteria bacterium]|nr:ABC transporter ATP-binding protein [Candidatus Magasanikbacteria bacterium]
MPRYLKYIWARAFRQRRAFLGLAGLLLISVGARLTEPYLYKVVVDTLTGALSIGRLATGAALETLGGALMVWLLLTIILNLTNAQASYLTWKLGNLSAQGVQIDGFRRLLRLDYRAHVREHSATLAKIVDNADIAVWEMTNWWLHRFASAILGFVGMLVIALSVNWAMTVISLAVIPFGLWLVIRHLRRYEDEQERVNKLWEAKSEHLSDQVSNIVTYKLNPREEWFVQKHAKQVWRAHNAQTALNRKWRLVEILNPDALARFLVLGAGVIFVLRGSLTLGSLFMFMGLLNEILTPLHLLGDILPQYARRAKQIERYLDLLEKPDTLTVPESPVRPSALRGEVQFAGVGFSYAGAESGFALPDISFTIPPGKVAALVGHSGSGKTTMMKLITRLLDPTAGTITIDGINLKEFDPEALKAQIGTVLQENTMYNETIAANIGYGKPEATRGAIIAAARAAEAHEFIAALPEGYDTLIGERGVRLSGGEKQRVAIARAMLKNPRLVVLDEPTSALDSITEEKVQAGLRQLMQGRSTLIIAHRLSTVRHADEIIVLAGGRIICRGTHETLLKECDTYRQMVELQVGGFLADKESRSLST